MSKRTAEKARLYRLRLEAEANNAKSPDIFAVTAYSETNWEACLVAEIFLDHTGYELPFSFGDWQRQVKAPVELYFVFEHKKQLLSFVRQIRKELSHMKLVI